jgi:hypothetical protein
MVRKMVSRVAPGMMAERAARHDRAVRERWGLTAAADLFIAEYGDRVLDGPFRGLRYWRGGDAPIAKLLGVYECEVSPWIAQALATTPASFIDLGAADGYYAVGAKVACPQLDVVAFELAATARRELTQLARLNGTSIAIRGRATARALAMLHLDRAVVLCDIEGAEADVLSGELPRLLASATVIVELHEHLRPGVTAELATRFAATHSGEFITPQERTAAEELDVLPEAVGARALDEHRAPGTGWARFLPR